jgi:hypothetical protein
MPNYQRLTDRTLATGVTENDLIHIVITGDTSQNPAGSSYKATLKQVGDALFSADTYVTGFTYSPNTLTLSDNSGTTFDATIDIMSGLTINGDLNVTGDTSVNGLSATTISATTYLNLSLGLGGTQYVFVRANGSDTDNAQELQDAYDTAKTMSPGPTNRVTVVAAPGNYNFGVSSFTMDTQYIDLVSLDGNRSIIFNGTETIEITTSLVFVKGVSVLSKNFTIGDDLSIRIENCQGGDYSFGGDPSLGSNPIIVSGSFINCTGGDYSFGFFGLASGTFTDCVGGTNSFGGDGDADGTFTNCVGAGASFGGNVTANGVFINCVGVVLSFGGGGTADGTFTNCVGDTNSFGGGGGTASGVFTDCVGGVGSFGGSGTLSGICNYCQGGLESFGNGGTLSGKLYYCRLTSGAFETVSGGGRTVLCIDGSDNQNNQ